MFAWTWVANFLVQPSSFWNHSIASGFFFCQFARIRSMQALRSASGVFIQPMKAARAARTALSMSSELPSITFAQVWAVFESVTSRVLPAFVEATHSPLMYCLSKVGSDMVEGFFPVTISLPRIAVFVVEQ